MALFEFLSAAARAGIISSNLVAFALHLLRFTAVMQRPPWLLAEMKGQGVNLALAGIEDESQRLFPLLDGAPGWRLVYWDGHFALFA